MTMTTTKTETKTKTEDLVAEHRECVEIWTAISHIAAACYPKLDEDARSAYEILPGLIDRCKETFDALPVESRPLHYLMV